MLHTHKPQTTSDAEQMALRNACRAEIIKRAMGDKYVGHPAKHIERLPAVALVEAITTVTDFNRATGRN